MNPKDSDLSQTDVLCIYGIKLEPESEQLWRDWLYEQQERYLIFLAEETDWMKGRGDPFFQDPRIRLYGITKENQEEFFKQIAWEFVFLRFSYFAAPQDLEKARPFFARLAQMQSGVFLLASDYSDLGVKVLQNVQDNVLHLPKAVQGKALGGQFQDVPAIICGCGPSLQKNIDLLSSLSDRALLFAGGSTLQALSFYSVRPHFSAGLDPSPPYRRFREQSAFEVPFLYQDRISSEWLSLVHAPLLWMADSGGYLLERWLREEFKLTDTPFDAGWNVSNFCMALSVKMGCNPIIFVGMDLSCSKTQVYAKGVEEELKPEKMILVHDSKGNPFSPIPEGIG